MDYLTIRNEIINNLRPLLIESFVEFYGEEHRNKISNLINSVIVVSVLKNETNEIIDKRLSKLSINTLQDGIGELSEDIIRFEYYKSLKDKKENDEDYYVLITSTDNSKNEYLKKFVKRMKRKCAGWVVPKRDIPAFFITGIKPNMATIIHEINHLLTEEDLGEVYDEFGNKKETLRSHGIHKRGFNIDLIYEIINELITQEVFDNFKRKYIDIIPKDYYYFISCGLVNNSYLQLDACSFDIVRNIYNRIKQVIKNSFISGSGTTIQKIIGDFNYDELRVFLIENKRRLNRFTEVNKDKPLSDYKKTLNVGTISELKRIKNNIEKSYNEYLEYNNNLNNYIDNLVSEGKGRKLN